MSYAIQSLLGLQGLIVVSVVRHFHVAYLYVLVRRTTGTCPHCSKRSKYIHGYRPPQMVKHILVGGSQLYLVIHKRRFHCRGCQQAFVETIPGLEKWSRHTGALADAMLLQLKETSFAAVTRTTNLTYRQQAKTLLIKVNPSTPDWESVSKPFVLGLDEQSFAGRDMLTTITDITHHKLLGVLEDDKKATLENFFACIPQDKVPLITAICTDMRVSFTTARSQYPHLAKIPLVIDKYHLIADANKRVNEERLLVQETLLHRKRTISRLLLLKGSEKLTSQEKSRLTAVLKAYPDLLTYYYFKEKLRRLYAKQTKKEASIALDTLIRMMYAQREKGASDWARTLERFHDSILNYFDFKVTNAFTEGIHTKCKLIKRQGFGYQNKQIYLRKLMLGFIPFALLMPPHLLQ